MGDRLLTPPEQESAELPVIHYPPPLPVARTWREKLAAWIPRFSLLNLLFLTMLIALAASFISLKASSRQEIAELERKIGRINFINGNDRRLFEEYSGLPAPTRIGAICLLPRTYRSETMNQYNLLLMLDPAKNYVFELLSSNSAEPDLVHPIRKTFLRAVRERSDARSFMQLEVQFWGENAGDGVNPKKPFAGRLDFLLRWHGWLGEPGRDAGHTVVFGKTPHIELQKHQHFGDFTNRFVFPKQLQREANLANFEWSNVDQENEMYSIRVKEISEQDVPKMPDDQYLFIDPTTP